MRTRFFRCQLPLMFFCGLLPIPVLMCHLLGMQNLLPWLAAPCAYLLFACLCLLLPGKWRLVPVAPAIAAMVAGSIFMLKDAHIAARILLPLMYSPMLIFTLPIAGWERGHEPPLFVTASCMIVHLLGQFILFANPTSNPWITPLLNAAFLVFVLLMMLSFNRQSVAAAMPESRSVPTAIRKRNRLLTYIMMGIVLLLSFIPVLAKAVDKLFEWLMLVIKTLIKWFMALFAQDGSSGGSSGGSQEEMLAGLGGGEAGALAKLLEKFLIVFSFILIAAGVFFALRFLWKKLKEFARYLYGMLRNYANSASEDYVDEVEDTRDQGGERETLTQKMRRRRNARRNLKELPPREQIRTRYGLLRGKHPEWAASGTARETLNEASAKIYEKARYSSHEITVHDSEAFAEQQKQ